MPAILLDCKPSAKTSSVMAPAAEAPNRARARTPAVFSAKASYADHPGKFACSGAPATQRQQAIERAPDGKSDNGHDRQPPRLQLQLDRETGDDSDADARGDGSLDRLGAAQRH